MKAYIRDGSLGNSITYYGRPTFHFAADETERTLVAACNSTLILDESGPWPTDLVPNHLRCNRMPCKKAWEALDTRPATD